MTTTNQNQAPSPFRGRAGEGANTCPTCNQPLTWRDIDADNKVLICPNHHTYVKLQLPNQPEQLVQAHLLGLEPSPIVNPK